jgi:hypothetical protein
VPEEWLIAEWPEGAEAPTDYWLSNLPVDTEPERLARLARMRWKIELDYRQLKGEQVLDRPLPDLRSARRARPARLPSSATRPVRPTKALLKGRRR